jgi:hypothetical protein
MFFVPIQMEGIIYIRIRCCMASREIRLFFRIILEIAWNLARFTCISLSTLSVFILHPEAAPMDLRALFFVIILFLSIE